MNLHYLQNNRIRNSLMIFIVIALSCACKRLSAQVPTAKLQKIENAFIKAFNDGAVEEFRAFFDEEMKKRNTVKKLNTNFSQTALQVGNICALILDESQENSFTYRSEHEKMITLKVIFNVNDHGKISKMSVNSDYKYKNAPVLERTKSNLILPFHDEWYVFWGGKKTSDNYHNTYPSMKGAFDFWVMGSNGKSHSKGANKNEDFYAFGKDIIAPVDAKVVYAFDEVLDNKWPAMNPTAGTGNVVLLETKNKEYILLGHLKYKSIKVKEGQMVKKGQLLGLCGNSGNSTEPHLHFQVQNIPDFTAAKGAWVHFNKIKVNGVIKEDYIPIRKDKISNLED